MEFLKEFGFNLYEIKIIESLFNLKKSNAKEISKKGKMPLNKVYQVIENLIKENLILEISSKPKKYILNDFDLYIKKKLKEKQENILNIEKEYRKYKVQKNISEDFYIYENLDLFIEKIIETYDKISFYSCALIEKWEFKYSSLKSTKEFIKRGGKVKFLGKITKPDIEIIKKWLEIGVEIKEITNVKKSGFSVFDDRYSRISIHNDEFKTIWSQNKDLNLILKDYFDKLWIDGKPITLKKLEELK